jgi:hypothetical protein
MVHAQAATHVATLPGLLRKHSQLVMRSSSDLGPSIGIGAGKPIETGAVQADGGQHPDARIESLIAEEPTEKHAADLDRAACAEQPANPRKRSLDLEPGGDAIPCLGGFQGSGAAGKASGWGCKQARSDAPPRVPWPTPTQESVTGAVVGESLGWGAMSPGFNSAKGAAARRSASSSASSSGSVWAEFALPLQRSPPLRPDTDLDAALNLVWKGDGPVGHDRWGRGSAASLPTTVSPSLPMRLSPGRRAMAV